MQTNIHSAGLRGLANRSWELIAFYLTVLAFCTLWLPERALAVGYWTALANQTNDNIGICLLLTDGTVLAEGSGNSWYSLSPDSNGHYVNGTWGPRHSSTWSHFTGSTAVLQSGNVFVAGGENGNGTNKVEIYHPASDSWTVAISSSFFGNIYDGNATLLPNGQVLIAPQGQPPLVFGGASFTYTFNPANNTLTQTVGGPLHGIGEASWVKLPNDNMLVIDSDNTYAGATTAEQYNPYTGIWGNGQSGVPNIWPNMTGSGAVSEMGPAFLLPNGNAIFFGGNGATAIYNTSAGTWSSGANYGGGGLGQKDAPGAMMVNGKVLLAVSPQGVNSSGSDVNGTGPTSFLEYDYTANGGLGSFPSAPNAPSGYAQLTGRAQGLFMLDLPDGTVLLSGIGHRCWVYQPDGSPLAAGKPTINKVQWNSDGSLHLTGTLFNGISQGASYGDNSQMDSNYPLVRFTDGSGNVYYGTTYNWSSTSVQTGGQIMTAEVTVPPAVLNFPANWSLQVVANGNASAGWNFYSPVWVNFNYSGFPLQNGWEIFPWITLPSGVSEIAGSLPGGTLAIRGDVQPSTGHETVPYTISTPMTIISVSGPSTIGN